MATLQIEATPSSNLEHYRLWIDEAADDDYVRMGAANKGSYAVPGTCGDSSAHKMRYVLAGPQGAKLAIKMLCVGGSAIAMPDLEIFEFSPAGGSVDFVL
jgi:hypothetical protein